jgi:hypothetical protein
MKHFTISGSVRIEGCPACGRNLRVEDWDADLIHDDFVGSGQTDSAGNFQITFSEEHYQGIFSERNPDLYFRIYRGSQLLKRTDKDILWNVSGQQLWVEIPLSRADVPECCSGSNGRRNYRRGITELLIPADRFDVINKATAKVERNAQERETLNRIIQDLRIQTYPLELVLADARLFARGSLRAANRLVHNLEQLTRRQAWPPANQARPANTGTPISLAGFIPEPPRLGGWDPCLMLPQGWVDILWALNLLEDINPEEIDAVDRYRRGVQAEIARLAPLETIYSVAIEVNLGSSWADAYFEKLVLASEALSRGIPGQQITRGLEARPFSGGAQPISADVPARFSFADPERQFEFRPRFDQSFQGFNACLLWRARETVSANRCWEARQAAPRYTITDIFNLTKEVSRQACSGDTVELRGTNLGTAGELQFSGVDSRLVIVSGEISEIGEFAAEAWNETSIRFVVPEEAGFSDEIWLCIEDNLPECSDSLGMQCRLPLGIQDLSLSIIPDLDLSDVIDFSLGGPQVMPDPESGVPPMRFIAEACTTISLSVELPRSANLALSSVSRVYPGTGVEEPISSENWNGPIADNQTTNQTFVLRAANLCSVVERRISLSIEHRIHPTPASLDVDVNGSLSLELRLSCPAPEDGHSLRLRVIGEPGVLEVSPALTIAAGVDLASVMVTGRAVGEAVIEITEDSGLYLPINIPVLVRPVVFTTTAISTWINEEIILAGQGFVARSTRVVFEIRGTSVSVDAEVAADGRARTTVPEAARNGSIRVEVSSAASGSYIPSRDSITITILNPQITEVMPASVNRGSTGVVVNGSGLSGAATNNTVLINATDGSPSRRVPVTGATVDRSMPSGSLTFTVPIDLSFFANLLSVEVSPADGDVRISNQLDFSCERVEGRFEIVVFNQSPDIYNCFTEASLDIKPPEYVTISGGTVEQFPVSFGPAGDRERHPATGAGPINFRVSNLLGGAGFSRCCSHVVIFSYREGAYEDSTPSIFDLTVYEVDTGHIILGEPFATTSGEGDRVARMVEVWFSPDCSVMAVVSSRTVTVGPGQIRFYDVPTPGSGGRARLLTAGTDSGAPDSFEASILSGNRLQYNIIPPAGSSESTESRESDITLA